MPGMWVQSSFRCKWIFVPFFKNYLYHYSQILFHHFWKWDYLHPLYQSTCIILYFWIGILFLLSYFYFKFLYSGFARENHCRIYISVHYCVMFIHYHVGFFIAFCFIFSVFWFSMCLSFLCCSRSPQKKPFSVQGYHDTRTTKYELQLSPSNLQMLCLL